MGLFDFLGGGSKTTVTQTTANQVDVGVTVQSIVDMTGIESVLRQLGEMFNTTAKQQTDATTQSANTTANGIQVLASAITEASSASLEQTKSLENKLLPWVKLISTSLVVYLLAQVWKQWK